MEMIVVYSSPDQSLIHQERFDGIDQVDAARRFAQERRGVLFIKVVGDPLQVENFVWEPQSAPRHRVR